MARMKPVYVGDAVFSTRRIAWRYVHLLALQQAGVVSDLTPRPEPLLKHPRVVYAGRTIRAREYRPDFSYKIDNQRIIEDIKLPSWRRLDRQFNAELSQVVQAVPPGALYQVTWFWPDPTPAERQQWDAALDLSGEGWQALCDIALTRPDRLINRVAGFFKHLEVALSWT